MPTLNNATSITEGNAQDPAKVNKNVPQWVPITLLGLSTVALVAPVILLRRQKTSLFTRGLESAAAPPRRTSTIPASIPAATSHAPRPVRPAPQILPSVTQQSTIEEADDFNGALYCAKAFGYATLMVLTGAAATIWGVKTYMGVETVEEFSTRMRTIVRTKMPALSDQIHRRPTAEDHPDDMDNFADASTSDRLSFDQATGKFEWSWPDAEMRLKDAFETKGFSGWAEAALRELEAEGQAAERNRRGHT